MNMKRTLVLGAVGGAVAVWFAAASTSSVRQPTPAIATKPDVIDVSGAQLAAEIARLHERLRPTDAPLQARDLFRYAHRSPGVRPAPIPRGPMPPEQADTPAPEVAPLKLVGIAEDVGESGPIRTAIVSGFGDLFLVKEGEAVTLRYRVSKVSADAVELTDVTNDSTLRLVLN
jgi:hypothetical protein